MKVIIRKKILKKKQENRYKNRTNIKNTKAPEKERDLFTAKKRSIRERNKVRKVKKKEKKRKKRAESTSTGEVRRPRQLTPAIEIGQGKGQDQGEDIDMNISEIFEVELLKALMK